ncbi:methyltransferase family protein [Crateriforma conspicua]|uniref:Isoprenylcysteine carboxyl methyltransferase (ICMT) family protein n=1 Tax=Crateriforma conspicua TaxID=2527996 RepID=A0A5C6FSE6_9PLAN|nr:isoprenylcysteine carboxylmethyltransferase family protein [Crateriforma conspicua]TWU63071.1 Isoprenylcysteine carboxyl methyltransferase (ICMT) family protein [Crateriforma conspicua]
MTPALDSFEVNKTDRVGWMLVTAQMFLAAALVLSSRWSPPNTWMLVLMVPGIAVAITAWLAIGLRRLRIHPTPGQQTVLTMTGPYRWVRHPMYVGLLLFTLAQLPFDWQPWRFVSWVCLLGVLWKKSSIEEDALVQRFESYHDYRSNTGRFLPRRSPSPDGATKR